MAISGWTNLPLQVSRAVLGPTSPLDDKAFVKVKGHAEVGLSIYHISQMV